MTTQTASRADLRRPKSGRGTARRVGWPVMEPAEPRLLLSAYVVTNTSDSGPGSLRQAIADANANAGADVITFNIPSNAVPTIVGDTYQITDPLTIDGITQPHSGAGPGVQLQGGATNGPGLMVQAPRCTIRGLSMFGFVSAIGVASNSEHTAIQGNYIGIRADGSIPAYPLSVTNAIDFAAPDCLIGGTAAGQGNRIVATGTAVSGSGATGSLIQGNVIDGPIYLGQATHITIGGTDPGAGNVIGAIELHGDQNTVQGNLIGLAADGKSPLQGVRPRLDVFGSGNFIGGDSAAARNVISGGSFNVQLTGSGNVIQGNFIGTDTAGTHPLINATPNPDDPFVGIWVNGANNIIGGAGPGTGNLIAGNPGPGIMIQPMSGLDQVTGNIVEGNRIGTDAAGTSSLPNGGSGIEIFLAPSGATIGGTGPGAGNVIAYNRGSGVDVLLSPSIQILGNSIYSNGGLGIDEGP